SLQSLKSCQARKSFHPVVMAFHRSRQQIMTYIEIRLLQSCECNIQIDEFFSRRPLQNADGPDDCDSECSCNPTRPKFVDQQQIGVKLPSQFNGFPLTSVPRQIWVFRLDG